jgi:hypothetical protein
MKMRCPKLIENEGYSKEKEDLFRQITLLNN